MIIGNDQSNINIVIVVNIFSNQLCTTEKEEEE